ncbi:MAG: phosphate ABC transporter permease subunit PstC [Acidobacteriota bacterium]
MQRLGGIALWSWACGLLAAAFFAAQVLLLVAESLPLWRHQGLLSYLFGERWFFRVQEFGALPMIYGTVAVATVALSLAAPIGIGAALFSAEYLGPRARWLFKTTVELLAAVPSVVYGLLGVLLLRDLVYRALEPFDPLSGDSLLTAGLLLAVMILPTVMTFADDALAGVSAGQRRAARALGLTHGQTVLRIALPQAWPGLVAAVLLALGRALGETIAVFLVVGRQDNQWPERLWSPAPLIEPGQTLTSKLGGSETFLAYGDSLHWAAIVGLGLVLLGITLTVTLAGHLVAALPNRWRRR